MKKKRRSTRWKVTNVRNLFLAFQMAIVLVLSGGHVYGMADEPLLNLSLKNVAIKDALWEIEKQSKMVFVYNADDLGKAGKISVEIKGKTVREALDICLKNSGFEYTIEQNTVVIKRKVAAKTANVQKITVKGKVVDKSETGLPGVTIVLKGTSVGVVTDMNGHYSITIPLMGNPVLVFSFIGMKKQEVAVNDRQEINVILEEDQTEMEEVVVTGIYSRKKESFTGSSQTYKAEELKMIGNQNILQSLKALDPAFNIMENNQYGSDPNRTPDIEIRGKTSIVGMKEEFGEDPNQPLFILDGFETTLETIMDLSLDRVASVTLLKDAASTAIYGAKAANGVVVVETKAPVQGRLRLSYNGSFEVSFADLTDYNLMNAAEKLEFELLAGNFKSNLIAFEEANKIRYNNLLYNVNRGVNTYWMSEPLRTGLTQRHNVYVEGGDSQMRYGLGINYTNIQGVMQESRRQVMSGNLDLLYRKGKLSYSNKLTVDYTKTNDPIVPFSEYSRANPYYTKYNEDGGIDKWLENNEELGVSVPNPLWNASLNSYDKGNTISIRDNFQMEYRPWNFLYVRARFGITKSTTDDETFRSPEDTKFDDSVESLKGSYTDMRRESLSYEGDFTITYGQLLADVHQINAVFGASCSESNSDYKSFSAAGFPEGNFTKPSFASGYAANGKPSYSDSKKRTANFYFNGGYSYDNRYLLDVNFRADGSSVFGSNKQFTTTWAIGLAWNLHNEGFIKNNTNFFSMLKLRASIGNPGNQNFGSYKTITTYKFNNWLLNDFGTGLLVDAFGDPDLEWQKTIDKNIGFDVSMFNNRFHVNFDYYYKVTDPLMASIGIPLSVGVSQRLANVGKQVSKGYNGTIKYAFIYRPKERINWTTSFTFRHGHSYYDKIGKNLDQYNKENRSNSLARYYDGGSPSDLWSVRSLGIDPATGKELFLTEKGRITFTYDYADEVVVGNSEPDLEGVLGNSFYYKGFSCNFYWRYSFGADAFNRTVYSKVENISKESLKQNQDKRALYDRWKEPGNGAKYKGISLTENTPISSRFVQKNNYLILESVRVAYEFSPEWMQKIHFSGMTVSAYMNDICRFSTIEDERGIDYPFARSFSFALSINF